jgi:hypothetical protein
VIRRVIEPSKQEEAATLVGVLNLDVDSGHLGRALMFAEDLLVQARLQRASRVELAAWVPGARAGRAVPAVEALAALEGLDALHECSDPSQIQRLAANPAACIATFPAFDEALTGRFQYDTTSRIKDGYDRLGSLPYLTMKPQWRAWARDFLSQHALGGHAVAVHLKQVAGADGQSNADLGTWRQFFAACDERHKVRFLLIGDDPCPDEILLLPNILRMRDRGGNLVRDLAIVEGADAFMGMASGPFNLALFGRKPYAVFKDPTHHTAEMLREIGHASRYGFACRGQVIRRISPRPADLMSALDDLLASARDQVGER